MDNTPAQDHVLTVRSFSDVISETDGIRLTCSCGQSATVAEGPDEPPDYESHGKIGLDVLNRLAAQHEAGSNLRDLAATFRKLTI